MQARGQITPVRAPHPAREWVLWREFEAWAKFYRAATDGAAFDGVAPHSAQSMAKTLI